MSDDRRKLSEERMRSMTAEDVAAISKKAKSSTKSKGLISRIKNKIKDFKELLGAYGLIYVPKTPKHGSHTGRVNGVGYSPRESFQETYRVSPPSQPVTPQFNPEALEILKREARSWDKMTDGEGDLDCNCK